MFFFNNCCQSCNNTKRCVCAQCRHDCDRCDACKCKCRCECVCNRREPECCERPRCCCCRQNCCGGCHGGCHGGAPGTGIMPYNDCDN